MEQKSLSCTIITPMFAGDADSTHVAIRGQSIKGLMRYWWRAYNAPVYPNIERLRGEEGKIFGTTEGDGQRSTFKIIIEDDQLTPTQQKFPQGHSLKVDAGKGRRINIIEYLAFGVCTWDRASRSNKIIRQYFKCMSRFKIKINIIKKDLADDILSSLLLLASFGGIGSKSRNGFGKFMVDGNQENFSFYKAVNKIKSLQHVRTPINFLSFNKAKLFKLKIDYDSWDHCLGELGKIYRAARLSLEPRHSYKKREHIAGPIIARDNYNPVLESDERRAKPYFLNVILSKNKYEGYILYLHSDLYHPLKGDKDCFREVCKSVNNYLADKMHTVI